MEGDPPTQYSERRQQMPNFDGHNEPNYSVIFDLLGLEDRLGLIYLEPAV
jgi:hypothetical protein